jgi:hypothetical protein
LEETDLIVEVPDGFLEVFDGSTFIRASQNVLDAVAEVEAEMAGDLNGFNPGWVRSVMGGVVDGVVF